MQPNSHPSPLPDKFPERISKELLHDLPLLAFEGPIQVLTDSKEARRVARRLMHEPVLGFDTETRPSFRKGEEYEVALLQLATRDECFLFRLNHLSLPDYLQRLLASPNSIKIGVALRDDIRALRRLNDFNPQGFVDLSEIGRQLGIVTVGLRNLAAILLKVRISKKAQLSNWERPKLDTTQQSYAATDAWICVEMLHYLQQEGFAQDLSALKMGWGAANEGRRPKAKGKRLGGPSAAESASSSRNLVS
ncbi:MAG: histidine kinase [Deltaproteobacteria bacterium]|nr:histidine kinase [Deltaproteobacteria bacterium]